MLEMARPNKYVYRRVGGQPRQLTLNIPALCLMLFLRSACRAPAHAHAQHVFSGKMATIRPHLSFSMPRVLSPYAWWVRPSAFPARRLTLKT